MSRLSAALIAITIALPASPVLSAANVTTGEDLYADYCSTCHGDELHNSSGGVTFDLRRLRSEDHDRFVQSVLNGKRQMPPWRDVLSLEQIEAIWTYIRAVVDR